MVRPPAPRHPPGARSLSRARAALSERSAAGRSGPSRHRRPLLWAAIVPTPSFLSPLKSSRGAEEVRKPKISNAVPRITGAGDGPGRAPGLREPRGWLPGQVAPPRSPLRGGRRGGQQFAGAALAERRMGDRGQRTGKTEGRGDTGRGKSRQGATRSGKRTGPVRPPSPRPRGPSTAPAPT